MNSFQRKRFEMGFGRSVSGTAPLSLVGCKGKPLSRLEISGNAKRTITIDGTEYDVPDGYTLLDNTGSTATAFYCKRNSDSATGTINLMTGVFTASSFTTGNTLPTPDMPLGVVGVGDYVGTKNQLSDYTKGIGGTVNGLTLTNHGDGSFSFSGTSTAAVGSFGFDGYNNKHIVEGHKYAVLLGTDVTTTNMKINLYDRTAKKAPYTTSSCEEGIFTADATYTDTAFYPLPSANASATGTFYPMIVDLTLMCGEGNEPTTIADVRAKLAEVYGYTADYYPHDTGTQSYKIPIKRNNSIVGTIYASEPLHNLNTYTDVLKAIEGKVSRAIGKITLDGTEAISYNATTAGVGCLLHLSFAQGKSSTVCIHSHGTSHYPWTLSAEDKLLICMGTSSRLFFSIRYGYCGVTEDMTNAQKAAAFKAWLAAQYAAGTPVTVYYPLATETEETITPISIGTPLGGTEYIDCESEVKPSNLTADYRSQTV